jgi:periplasmic divalent cation tolerance protein
VNPSDALVVLCTCPDEATAESLARTLVTERLAACVNRLSGVRSTYRWQDAVAEDAEVLLLIKTIASRYGALELRLKALHPYEVPEIIGIPATLGSSEYLAWLVAGASPS